MIEHLEQRYLTFHTELTAVVDAARRLHSETEERWRPLALLTGRLGLDVEVLAGPTRATVELARSFAGQFVVDRLDGELDLAWLGTALPAPAFDASGRVVVEGVELGLGSDGWPRSAQGRLELRDGALRAPLALRIGAADGTLQVNDEDHLEIAFRMLPGSPLEGDGRVQLATDGRYSLAANLAPGQAADAATRELLRMAGPAQPGGRVGIMGTPPWQPARRDDSQATTHGASMSRSHDLFTEAQELIPGGVNSPVRAFRGVGGDPVFVERAEGAYLIDADDKRYIDYVGSWGPMIVGHAHPDVVRAVQEAAARGLGYGTPTAIESRMARKVLELMPTMEMVRMVSSGTEATMTALRLARGFTGRDKIVKFEGCYHGHSDSLLIKAGSGALTLGVPTSPGVPAALAEHTLTLPFNDLDACQAAFAELGGEIACVIVEPVAGNMNCVPPRAGFLEGLRTLCDTHGILLILDEVMTGFRVALGGAQALYGITPDLTTLGKVIGGGLPVAALGGRREVMEHLAPVGPVYQAGTLSGNPVAMAAGLATLEIVATPGFHDDLTRKADRLCDGILAAARDAGVPMTSNRVGGMFGLFFTDAAEVTCFADVMACDVERFKRFFHGMLDEGVYLAPSAFEAGFVSAAHGDAEIDATVAAAGRVLRDLAG